MRSSLNNTLRGNAVDFIVFSLYVQPVGKSRGTFCEFRVLLNNIVTINNPSLISQVLINNLSLIILVISYQ